MKYFLILLCFTLEINPKSLAPCIMGNAKKCLGYSDDNEQYSLPNPDAKLINQTYQPNDKGCFKICADTVNCFMAAYIYFNKSCIIYENISYSDVINYSYQLYFWRCCNTNQSNPAPNRCPGFWKYKQDTQSYNSRRINDSIVQIPNANLYDCQLNCLHNPVCGSINIRTSDNTAQIYCELIIGFPVETLVMRDFINWITYMWHCADNYTLPDPDSNCISRPKDSAGYWFVENRNIKMNSNIKTVLYFHTYNYEACLTNCLQYQHCQRAWYSLDNSFCMLESNGLSECADTQASNTYVFTTFKWKYCTSFLQNFNEIQNQKFNCRKIISNHYIYISHTKCGHLPSNEREIYPCSKPILFDNSLSFFPNFHCQINQSFQVLYQLKENISHLGEFSKLNWIRVFTGYESFWLANVTDVNFPLCEQSECNIYNANDRLDESNELKIFTREQWLAKKSKGAENKFPSFPVPFVIITDTERPYCNCFTEEACSYQIREIQDILINFVAIPYNFIITGDGGIYKSKGLEFENKATGSVYNGKSLSIALCGRYHHNPGIASLNAVKRIIKLSIENKKVAENYTLLLLRDIGTHNLPFEGLLRVIELWPHYRGHLTFDCSYDHKIIIFINIASTLLVCLLVLLIVHIYIYKIQHNRYCHVLRVCRIESIYGTICKKPREIFPQIFINNFDKLTNENMFISPFLTSLFWIENKLTIGSRLQNKECQCQASVFSIFNLCRFQSNLIDPGSLAIMPEFLLCSKNTTFIFERFFEPGCQCFIILHCTSVDYFKQFVNQLYENRCLCRSFQIVKYTSKSKTIFMGHNCFEEPKYTQVKRQTNRTDMENKYGFLLDENNCMRFYKNE